MAGSGMGGLHGDRLHQWIGRRRKGGGVEQRKGKGRDLAQGRDDPCGGRVGRRRSSYGQGGGALTRGDASVCSVVLVWYVFTGLGSITENAVAMGARVPSWLSKILEVSKKAIDAAGDAIASDKEDLS